MIELLSPAGSPEGVIAAVQNMADAVYFGFGRLNARQNAQNFTEDEFASAVRYCRVRGCKVYFTLNTLVSDREMGEAARLAILANDLGVDAVIVQDLGLCSVLRSITPRLPIHASTQMSVHSLPGVLAAAELGISRVVLARELSFKDIEFIASRSPIELEVFVHGALCFCYSGQCYMSSLIGRRSGNRGLCAQPCRLDYSMGKLGAYPLSLRDNCLAEHIAELEAAGVSCLKIEGRMRRPEYTAIATSVYAAAIKDKRKPTAAELEQLEAAFSRQGFTDGYLTGDRAAKMFGVKTEPPGGQNKLFADTRRAYSSSERRRVPVSFYAMLKAGEPSKFAVEDDDGNRVTIDGAVPAAAVAAPITEASLTEQLYKTGGTPYSCRWVRAAVEPGLFLPVSEINEYRRLLISKLTERRKLPPPRPSRRMLTPVMDIRRTGTPVINIQFTSGEQMTEALADIGADTIYAPLELLCGNFSLVRPFTERGANIAAVLPRVYTDAQSGEIREMLKTVYEQGVEEALVGNLGHIRDAKQKGFRLRADFGFNAFNSHTLSVLRQADFLSAAVSFELRLKQIAAMRKPLDTELIAYGRLPLMLTEHCLIKNSAGRCLCDNAAANQLSDRQGALFNVTKAYGCRNVILNSKKLFLADKRADYENIGLWGIRLMFTTESPKECLAIAKAYSGAEEYQPNGITRGLYYRGVE